MEFPASFGITFTSKLHNKPAPELKALRLPSPFVVVVVGASRNIGAETAKAFAAAGATGIVITAGSLSDGLLSTKKELEALSPTTKVTALGANLNDPESAAKVLEAVKTEHGGRLDVLINSAAIMSSNPSAFNEGDLAAIDVSQIVDTYSVNLVGKFAVFKALVPLLLETDGAKTVINLTSATAHFSSSGSLGYNLSQIAVNRLTEAIAESYGSRGILAHAVHPGIVPTMPPPIGLEGGRPWAELVNDDPGLCGAFLLWLVQDRRGWLSGRYLSANWDVEELEQKKDEIVNGDKLKFRMVV